MSDSVLLGDVLREMVAELRLKQGRKTGTEPDAHGEGAALSQAAPTEPRPRESAA